MREHNKFYLLVAVIIILSLPLSYGLWVVGKRINYAWQYEDMVRETVRDMVRPSALKE